MKQRLIHFFMVLTALAAAAACKVPTSNTIPIQQPRITKQPRSVLKLTNSKAELTIEAESLDGGTIHYQWYEKTTQNLYSEGGRPIGGAKDKTYKVVSAEERNTVYYCIVTNENDAGEKAYTYSDPVSVKFVKSFTVGKPSIIVHPLDQKVKLNKEVILTVQAESPDCGEISYQWYQTPVKSNKGGTKIDDATQNSYKVPTDEEGEAYYYCLVSNTHTKPNSSSSSGFKDETASVKTEAAAVAVTDEPAVNAVEPVIQHFSTTYAARQNTPLTLTIHAGSPDGGTLSYTWYRTSEPNTESGTIVYSNVKPMSNTEKNAAKNSITISHSETGIYYYYCIVTNKNDTASSNRIARKKSLLAAVTVTERESQSIAEIDPIDMNGRGKGYGWKNKRWELGSKKSGGEITFAVYSKNAEKVLLEIYRVPYGEKAVYQIFMEKNPEDNIWRAKLDVSRAGLYPVYYGFRVWGANWPYSSDWEPGTDRGFKSDVDGAGNRFNPNKLLFDPYARELSHDKSNKDALNGKNGTIYASGEQYRTIDTALYAPKAIVLEYSAPVAPYRGVEQKDAIIYEAHVRGLTKHHSSSSLTEILGSFDGFDGIQNIPDNLRGTYAGAALMAPYLKGLGINTIELLPVHESDNDGNPDDRADAFTQFWGYMTYGFFAPDRRYSSDKSPGGPTREFKAMVEAFHEAKIEVYLDVVYNHTGEGGLWNKEDPSVAGVEVFRGFDNSEYYALVPNDKRYYYETTGCGNNMRCDNLPVHNFVMDSLKYWADEMGVDGFRFDLAPVLGQEERTSWNKWWFNPQAKLLTEISRYAKESKLEVIAEAWAAGGDDAYQVGNYPYGWGEWNGRYRDAIRRYINHRQIGASNENEIGYTTALHGDYNHFNDQGGACKSVNFITAHDGFTLADLVSYTGRQQNTSNGWPFGPSDGGNENNDSSDSGGNHPLRRQRIRNALTLLLFSRGVPMIVYGDEFGRTQNGNNNPYNLDSIATWNNYEMLASDTPQGVTGGYHNNIGTDNNHDGKNGLFMFAKHLINLRKKEPALRQADYSVEIKYETPTGAGSFSDSNDWACRMYIAGSKVTGGSDYVLCINMHTENIDFILPTPPGGKKWVCIVNTDEFAENEASVNMSNNVAEDSKARECSGSYGVKPQSIAIFKAVTR
ncbi:MAG: alpha-amylase family glycosyl hydrolase [Treponema sp.]